MRRLAGLGAVALLLGACATGAASPPTGPADGATPVAPGSSSIQADTTPAVSAQASVAATLATSPVGPPTYVWQEGDTPSRIARTFGVTVAEILAANPQIDWTQIRGGDVISLPVNATLPSPSPAPSASAPARTFPPLPAIAVIAKGKFTADEGIAALTTGTTFQLQFRFDGGPVTGSGSRPLDILDRQTCKATTRTEATFSGTFDPLTRQIRGTVHVTETGTVSYATTDACRSLASTSNADYAWTAQVSDDGGSLTGTVTDFGTTQPFEATITEAG